MQRNPQNNLPEPLGILVILANFCFGLWNVYSNMRQETRQSAYDKRQEEIICLLEGLKCEREGEHCGYTDEKQVCPYGGD